MTKTNENRLPVWAQPVTKKLDLSSFFINARGEVSGNLDTSKSKVAVALREERAAEARSRAEEEARLEEEEKVRKEEQRKLNAELASLRREKEAERQRKLEVADLQRELRTTSQERDNKIKLALHNSLLFDHEKRDLFRTAAFLAKQIAAIRNQLNSLKKGK